MAHDSESHHFRDGLKSWIARCNTCGWWRTARGKAHAEELATTHRKETAE